MTTTTTHVKLCKKPDSVCLQGGCGYCSDNSDKTGWWALGKLSDYAFNRGMSKDFLYGRRTNWPNREKRTQ